MVWPGRTTWRTVWRSIKPLIEEMAAPFVMPTLRGHCRFVQTTLRENVVTQGAALLAMKL